MKFRIKTLSRLPLLRKRQTTLIHFADPVYEIRSSRPLPTHPTSTRPVIEFPVSSMSWVENRKRKRHSLLEVPGHQIVTMPKGNPEDASCR
ncbi:MAG: hypothetical protein R3F07_03545 [Opitutaceae bacterium]